MISVDQHYAGIEQMSADVRRMVEAAYQRMLADIRNGASAQKAAERAFSSFSGEYKEQLAAALSERMTAAIGVTEIKDYPVSGGPLSRHLYAQAKATALSVANIVRTEAKGWHDSRKLAIDLYEGYGFRQKEALPVRIPLPTYLRQAVGEEQDVFNAWAHSGSQPLRQILGDPITGPALSRELAKIRATALKTPALRAAYLQAITALENGVGFDRISKALKTAWFERNRYFANRIAQTELHRAFTDTRAVEIVEDVEVQAVKLRMSSKHPRYDICDLLSKQDRYGLGPGVYPKDKAPKPPFHPHCLPGDSLITSCGRITAVSKRWYDGDMVVVTTASGKRLTATINHPILTRRGWVGAGLLDIRDEVVTSLDRIPVRWDRGLVNDQHQYMPTSIAEIFDAFMSSGKVSSRKVPVASEDFHGDGMAGQIAIIGAYGELRYGVDNTSLQVGTHHIFEPANTGLCGLLGECVSDLGGKRFFYTPYGVVCGRCKRCPLVLGEFGHAQLACLAPVAEVDAMIGERFGHRATLNPVFFCDCQTGHPLRVIIDNGDFHIFGDGLSRLHNGGANFAPGPQCNTSVGEFAFYPRWADLELSREILNGATGDIFFDAVVNINVFAWSGHVYNLETDNGFYTCNDIITHNCKCTAHAVFAIQKATPRERTGAGQEYLRTLDTKTAAQVMGSRDRLNSVLGGADPVNVWNKRTDPAYKVRAMGEVAKGTVNEVED